MDSHQRSSFDNLLSEEDNRHKGKEAAVRMKCTKKVLSLSHLSSNDSKRQNYHPEHAGFVHLKWLKIHFVHFSHFNFVKWTKFLFYLSHFKSLFVMTWVISFQMNQKDKITILRKWLLHKHVVHIPWVQTTQWEFASCILNTVLLYR